MSSPPSQLENTAPVLPVSPVPVDPPPVEQSQGHQRADVAALPAGTVDTGSETGATTTTTTTTTSTTTDGRTSTGTDAGDVFVPAGLSIQTGLPATAPSPPPTNQDLPPPSSAQAAAPPSNPDQNKKPRGPVLQRPSGPSLLTQALASARGILPTAPNTNGAAAQPDLNRAASHNYVSQGSSYDSSGRNQPKVSNTSPPPSVPTTTATATSHKDVRGDSSSKGDGGSLTTVPVRFAPRSPAMAASAVVSTVTVSASSVSSSASKHYPSSSYDGPEPGGIDSRHRAHYSLRPHNGDRVGSSEKLNWDEPARVTSRSVGASPGIGSIGEHTSSPSPNLRPHAVSQTHAKQGEDSATTTEGRKSQRPRNIEQRVSMGPEKIWSIGSGEPDSQDGQVEKSVTEVLSGVEHNNRSRKASHSLRFFKEGLPEEKINKKKDSSRHGGHGRELLSPPLEAIAQAETPILEDEDTKSALHQSPRAGDVSFVDPDFAHRPPKQSIDTDGTKPDSDYFGGAEPVDTPKISDTSSRHQDIPSIDDYSVLPEPALSVTEQVSHERRGSGDSTVSGGTAEDADDSGEEKISSAVFVPHKAPQEPASAPEAASAAAEASLQRQQPGHRAVSRGDDWLVKADEPEADRQEELEPECPAAIKSGQNRTAATSRTEAAATEYANKVNAVKDVGISNNDSRVPIPSRAPSEHYDEQALDQQQLATKQPLEAIELIPYKHQVGGHTTLWRFSKRAVCKQLNNRENEFYERVERDVRDLLAFLPRYIGVLNVTFHKQPRRKSTLKREDAAALDRKLIDQTELKGTLGGNGSVVQHEVLSRPTEGAKANPSHHRVISQSLQSSQIPVPTVTFVDNQHILPRHLLQPSPQPTVGAQGSRTRSSSAAMIASDGQERRLAHRPTLEDRHANSWGATTVNKRLRNEVFNDVFLKHPVPMRPHRRSQQRALPRPSLPSFLRATTSEAHLDAPQKEYNDLRDSESNRRVNGQDVDSFRRLSRVQKSHSDLGPDLCRDAEHARVKRVAEDEGPKDITGTSAPEPEIPNEKLPPNGRRRRYSGTALRRKPNDDLESRGNLQYFQEPDDADVKPDSSWEKVDAPKGGQENGHPKSPAEVATDRSHGLDDDPRDASSAWAVSNYPSTVTSGAPSPTAELKRIPRPINPKEAQTQRDSRVEYFLLLEDLTAGMKRPCIMDLKMGTRQYGVDAGPKKQKSQQRKCSETTSRALGVRVCGLQVWDAKTQTYIFRDKYYGRGLKQGSEFQGALERFLYDGVDRHSILRHIPTVLHKLRQLEEIISRLDGYRFYAASLLMFYDGDTSQDNDVGGSETAVEDSATDFATDTEEAHAYHGNGNIKTRRKNKREIDFKMADFANSVTAGDPSMAGRPCPPQHPGEPDRGFLRGLRSLRRYFLKIQRETREELGLGLASAAAAGGGYRSCGGAGDCSDLDEDYSGDEGSVSE